MIHSPFNMFMPVAIGCDHAGFDYKEEIINYFNDVLESQRLKMEEEITSNIKHSLKNILQTLN